MCTLLIECKAQAEQCFALNFHDCQNLACCHTRRRPTCQRIVVQHDPDLARRQGPGLWGRMGRKWFFVYTGLISV